MINYQYRCKSCAINIFTKHKKGPGNRNYCRVCNGELVLICEHEVKT